MKNIYEQIIESLVNDDEARARELFHQEVVRQSREIYNQLISEEAEEEDEMYSPEEFESFYPEEEEDENMEPASAGKLENPEVFANILDMISSLLAVSQEEAKEYLRKTLNFAIVLKQSSGSWIRDGHARAHHILCIIQKKAPIGRVIP